MNCESGTDLFCYKNPSKFIDIYFTFQDYFKLQKQESPGIVDFISLIGANPKKLTKSDYETSIIQPVTQYENLQGILDRSHEAIWAVGQDYAINNFALDKRFHL